MRKIIRFLLLSTLLTLPCLVCVLAEDGKSKEEMFQEMVYAALYQDIENAVVTFYSPYLATEPLLDTFSYEFLDTKNTGNHTYEIKIVVYPFVGAHNTIGKDSIVLELSPYAEIKVLSYEHLESYDNVIKNSVPQFQMEKWFKKPLPLPQ